jgi:radical SAM superfamily enzyme YgiQ (UPF0313 family)
VHVKFVLPALTSEQWTSRRRIKYSLWPPLGLATLAGYLGDKDTAVLQDENVEGLDLDDAPDLVAIQAYVSSAKRAYEIADHYRNRGTYVALGGIHTTSLPAEAIRHADSIFLGPGEDTWPRFLDDFRAGRPLRVYRSRTRTLRDQPPVRRDLIKRDLYLAPNSLVVSRGCPHACEFCSNSAFFRGGKSFYTQSVDQALAEVDRLPGRHLYFLDDHIFGNRAFAEELFEGLRGMGRVWQSAGTVDSALDTRLLRKAVDSGLRTLLVGFETLSAENLAEHRKTQNFAVAYDEAVRILHDHGAMINASFVVGLDDDDESVFDRTVEWAVSRGVETATFHIFTPYPGTRVYERMEEEGRILTRDWNLYDTAHVVSRPAKMSPDALEAGYHRASESLYAWRPLARSAAQKSSGRERLRQLAYAAGWGRFRLPWHLLLRADQVGRFTPLLESIVAGFGPRETLPVTGRTAESSAVGLPLRRTRRAQPHRLRGRAGEDAHTSLVRHG